MAEVNSKNRLSCCVSCEAFGVSQIGGLDNRDVRSVPPFHSFELGVL